MTFLSRWHYPTTSTGRDLRLDLLRGYCVAVMTIDHVGLFPAWTQAITGGAQLWTTAAEGFVLIAGLVFGVVFGRYSLERGWSWTVRRIGQRAILLYAIGVIGHWLINTIDYVLRLTRQLDTSVPESYFDLIQAAIFQTRRAPANFDLMPLYALLGFWGLLALFSLRRTGWSWVLGGSVALWYAARLQPRAFTIFAMYFSFAIWQVLFIIGLILGYYYRSIAAWWSKQPLAYLRSVLVVTSALGVLWFSYQININGAWPEVPTFFGAAAFSRPLLAPLRIIFTLWIFAGLYLLVTVLWQPIKLLLGWVLLPLGQHALTAFVLQSFAAYAIMRLPGWPFPDHDPTLMGFIHLGIVLAIWAATLATVYIRTRWSLRRLSRSSAVAEA
ncbi:MAG: OpgC domain-containing protein [Anaerolineae bacterium]